MEWISIKDKLPEYYTDVVVIERNGDASWYMVAYLAIGGIWALAGGRRIIGVVTHWMPLPEPPKEEEK